MFFYRSTIMRTTDSESTIVAQAATADILSCSEYRKFWITWWRNSDDVIELKVGQGDLFTNPPFMTYKHDSSFGLNVVTVSTSLQSSGKWLFPDNAGIRIFRYC